MIRIFIDGSAGTTGLRIRLRLAERRDVELVTLPDEKRKDSAARREALNTADAVFLCLPDEAAREAVAMIENPEVTVFDTSTAHRTAPGWVYGFPELSPRHRESICSSRRISVPGCHASGFIALVYPLIEEGVLPAEALLTCWSLTGYSGGGKAMITQYSESARDTLLEAPRQYGLTQQHKHLREMQAVTGLCSSPVFCPVVADYYSGMEVTVSLFPQQLCPGTRKGDLCGIYRHRYGGRLVFYREDAGEGGFLSAAAYAGRDSMEITVHGNEEKILLCARYDNLGKGASGAALECLNLTMGLDPATGLIP